MDQQLNQQNQKVMPSSYLALSIIASFFCWPFAIPAIINASKVESLWYQGQYNEAVESSKSAKKWSIIAFVMYGVSIILLILFYVLYFVIVLGAAVASEM